MGRMSDLDIALTPIEHIRLIPWSLPTLAIHVVDDDSLRRAVPQMWRGQVNRWLTVEWWVMGSNCLMFEVNT